MRFSSKLTQSQVDWAVVATKAGYKDAKTANTRYGQIMKKLTGVSAGKAMSGISSAPTSPVKKTTGAPKKVVGSGTNKNASKVTKSRPPQKKIKVDVGAERPSDEEEEEDGYADDTIKIEARNVYYEDHEGDSKQVRAEFVDAEEEFGV